MSMADVTEWAQSCIWELFFFRAEDCIRDGTVTGVQTCALPILGAGSGGRPAAGPAGPDLRAGPPRQGERKAQPEALARAVSDRRWRGMRLGRIGYINCYQIGRASCRERVLISLVLVLTERINDE